MFILRVGIKKKFLHLSKSRKVGASKNSEAIMMCVHEFEINVSQASAPLERESTECYNSILFNF